MMKFVVSNCWFIVCKTSDHIRVQSRATRFPDLKVSLGFLNTFDFDKLGGRP